MERFHKCLLLFMEQCKEPLYLRMQIILLSVFIFNVSG